MFWKSFRLGADRTLLETVLGYPAWIRNEMTVCTHWCYLVGRRRQHEIQCCTKKNIFYYLERFIADRARILGTAHLCSKGRLATARVKRHGLATGGNGKAAVACGSVTACARCDRKTLWLLDHERLAAAAAAAAAANACDARASEHGKPCSVGLAVHRKRAECCAAVLH